MFMEPILGRKRRNLYSGRNEIDVQISAPYILEILVIMVKAYFMRCIYD